MSFAEYQFGIYLKGLEGETPSLPMRVDQLEQAAREALDEKAYWYVAGGAGDDSMRANREAFYRWRILPRMLRDVASRDLSLELLGQSLAAPLLLAPIGVQEIVHPEAELAVARAAAALGIPMVLSTVSSVPMERVGEIMGEVPHWFQLYWPRDREITRSFLRRAESAGFGALVVTLDTRFLAWRERDLQQAFLPFLRGQGLANYATDPVFRDGLASPPEEDMGPAIERWSAIYSDPSQTWDDLAFLRDSTRLPIVLKGILHPEDAVRAADLGMDALIVSNHGGRQVEGAVAALDALAEVSCAVGDRLPLLFDSGIRHGGDILKALALGARAVLLGRPYIWGLALAGQDGVREVLQRLLADLDLNLALSGCRTLAEVNRGLLRQA
ncbi:MAG TPA: alpha-hydroxy-acid oxidizing protein [Gammaproteobacteria bacterium]|nr:alpha-hydroxy-acid oxidizing protein [Gammaproteobacteria bacterium]